VIIDPAGPRRGRAGAVSGITGLRINPPGAEAELVNMSPTGLLAESPAKQRVGTAVEVQFQGGFTPSSIAGHVVRCEVAIMGRDGLLRYHLGIEFDSTIPLAAEDEEEEERDSAAPPPVRSIRNRW
jgi:hypothetical protein